jgi:tryptophan synthase alpha chain
MNRIKECFKDKEQKILSVYFTAGFPELDDTVKVVRALDKSGADMIEIGMPFSDPVADGPVIQRSSEKALKNGMSVNLLFEQLKDIRRYTKIPLILMGYINPVYKFGVENFLKKCSDIGIDGTIIPDLPFEEYVKSYQQIFMKYGLINIFLVSPQTSAERIRQLDETSEGFLYIVSSSATTGAMKSFREEQLGYFRRISDMHLKSPKLIGFGISNHDTYAQACTYAEGGIIGSACVRALQEEGSVEERVERFMSGL